MKVGGVIFWSRLQADSTGRNKTVLGVERNYILNILHRLKSSFDFTSFEDLQIEGICRTTGLPPERARFALARTCTEPLIWNEPESRIEMFSEQLKEHGLTLTRGGRFWHVSGNATKGAGMGCVVERLSANLSAPPLTVAVGDSPIDQSMLDAADYPIAIASPDGKVHVSVDQERGRISRIPGSLGWAETVSQTLDELLASPSSQPVRS